MESSLQTTNTSLTPPPSPLAQEEKKKDERKFTRDTTLARERQVAVYRTLADNPHNWMTTEEVSKDPRVAVIPGGQKDVQNSLRRVTELNLCVRKKEVGRRVVYRWNVHARAEDIELLVKGAKKFDSETTIKHDTYPVSSVDRYLDEPMEVYINGINYELAGANKVMLERIN